jgi:hypothetical protein
MPRLRTRERAEVPAELFIEYFRDSIEVLFDWEYFIEERWPVTITITSAHEEVAKWYMPWNINQSGEIVRFDHPEARPIQVDMLRAVFERLDIERQDRVRQIKIALTSFRPPILFAVPTYALPNGDRFLLDGNHRVSSIFLHLLPFRFLTLTLHGPIEARVFPELAYWEEHFTIQPQQEEI